MILFFVQIQVISLNALPTILRLWQRRAARRVHDTLKAFDINDKKSQARTSLTSRV